MKRLKLLVISCFSICCINSLYSQDVKASHINSGFIDFNAYYDTREVSTLTINALANLPNRLQYFSLTNFDGADNTSDINSFFTEQNLRWNLNKDKPLDLTLQWAGKANTGNDCLRLGFRYRLNKNKLVKNFFEKLNFSYSLNFHILQYTVNKPINLLPQLEHVYRFNFMPSVFKNKLYLSGFADQNIVYSDSGKTTFNWVSEHQLGYNVIDYLFIVLEYRINDYLPKNNYGLGYGLEYKINF